MWPWFYRHFQHDTLTYLHIILHSSTPCLYSIFNALSQPSDPLPKPGYSVSLLSFALSQSNRYRCPSRRMRPVMQTAFRLQDNLTLPLSSHRHGHQLKSESTFICDAETETLGDIAITVTVESVVHYSQDSGRAAINSDGLCNSGRFGPRTPSWFSYGLHSASCVLLRSNVCSQLQPRTRIPWLGFPPAATFRCTYA